MAAFAVLIVMIVGPLYAAVSGSHSFSDGSRCTMGQIGCDTPERESFPS
ncbi:hypothetical protein [Acuticoccus sediminis]|nr:hypothetical protein [Acuticoccus sediminis]